MYSIQEFSKISKPFRGILLDAYGVFWGGNAKGMLPGSREVMEKLVQQGKTVGILSNTTQFAVNEMNKLIPHGLIQETHYHFFLTSGDIAKQVFMDSGLPFKTPRKKFWLFGDPHPTFTSQAKLFEGSPYEATQEIAEADFIVVSIPHINGEDQMDADLFIDGLREIMKYQLPMVCANPDRFAHEGNPARSVVRQGSIAALYEQLGGEVFYIGKPFPLVYKAALEKFTAYGISEPKDILMVGDTPETDIKGARSCGMASALVMKTGIMADRIRLVGLEKAIQEITSDQMPDFFIESFADDKLYPSP